MVSIQCMIYSRFAKRGLVSKESHFLLCLLWWGRSKGELQRDDPMDTFSNVNWTMTHERDFGRATGSCALKSLVGLLRALVRRQTYGTRSGLNK
jgi:hypothetical protein